MVAFLLYAELDDDPWDRATSSDTLELGTALKRMVMLGSETLNLVSTIEFLSSPTVLFVSAGAFGRGKKI